MNKEIFIAENIEVGDYFIRPLGLTCERLQYARTVVVKIGWTMFDLHGKYGTISCLTDGWFNPIGTLEEMADHLNKYDYVRLPKERYLQIVKDIPERAFIGKNTKLQRDE